MPPTTELPTSIGERPQSVSALDSHLGFWLRYVSNHVSSQFEKRLKTKDVSVSEWVALRQLFQVGKSSAVELMNSLGMTKGAISKIVTRLQAKGLVTRAVVNTDRRAQFLALTPLGQELVPQLAQLADENDDAFFGHLSSDQRTQLIEMMQELVARHQLKQVPVE
jgi:DNA-binding MarR family transcriptional regulator